MAKNNKEIPYSKIMPQLSFEDRAVLMEDLLGRMPYNCRVVAPTTRLGGEGGIGTLIEVAKTNKSYYTPHYPIFRVRLEDGRVTEREVVLPILYPLEFDLLEKVIVSDGHIDSRPFNRALLDELWKYYNFHTNTSAFLYDAEKDKLRVYNGREYLGYYSRELVFNAYPPASNIVADHSPLPRQVFDIIMLCNKCQVDYRGLINRGLAYRIAP